MPPSGDQKDVQSVEDPRITSGSIRKVDYRVRVRCIRRINGALDPILIRRVVTFIGKNGAETGARDIGNVGCRAVDRDTFGREVDSPRRRRNRGILNLKVNDIGGGRAAEWLAVAAPQCVVLGDEGVVGRLFGRVESGKVEGRVLVRVVDEIVELESGCVSRDGGIAEDDQLVVRIRSRENGVSFHANRTGRGEIRIWRHGVIECLRDGAAPRSVRAIEDRENAGSIDSGPWIGHPGKCEDGGEKVRHVNEPVACAAGGKRHIRTERNEGDVDPALIRVALGMTSRSDRAVRRLHDLGRGSVVSHDDHVGCIQVH